MARLGRITALGIALACAAGPLGCGSEPPAPPIDRVVLVTIDTLRADRVGAYGDAAAHTPTLDALAAAGVRFDQAISPTPITRPSHATLLTGLDPPAHGVRGNSVFALDAGIPTLPEQLAQEGFATAAFIAAFVLDGRFGLDRGFDVYDDDVARRASASPFSYAERPADAVVDNALAWVRTAPERFFLWVHLYDPHANYEAPAGYDALAGGDPYGGEVAFADAQVGRLLAGIRRRFGPGGMAVLVTSDHGEGLGDHGEATHSLLVYDATQHVPLILHAPGLPRGAVIEDQVRLMDVAPTLLELAQAPPLPDAAGVSLLPRVRGEQPPGDTLAYLEAIEPQLSLGWSPILGVRTGSHKYLRAPRPELYDLTNDPGERINLAAQDPDRVAALDAEVEAIVSAARAPSADAALDDADRARLQALGYLMPEDDALEGLVIGRVGGPDPKDHIAVASAMQRAGGLIADGFGDRALAILAAIEDPGRHILLLRANAATLAGRNDILAESGAALVALDPDKPDHHYVLGLGLTGEGRLDEAELAFQAGLAIDAEHAPAWFGLGLVAQARGDETAALAHFTRADAFEKPPSSARLKLALAQLAAGEREEAEALLATLAPTFADQPETAIQIANVEWERGEREAALERLAASARNNPRSRPAWAGYAARLQAAGRYADAVQAWRHIHAIDPQDPGGQNDLAWGLAVADQQLDEALRLVEAARGALGETPEVLDTLAAVQLARGDAAAALAAADRALPAASDRLLPHLHFVRAAALSELDRSDEARSALAALLPRLDELAPPWRDRTEGLARELGVRLPAAAAS